jgi:D-glycero-D-manno-heptose 1,7-bisphosphate phosphatase
MIKAVFLDRDGVLCDNVYRDGKLSSAHNMEELIIRPETIEACHALKKAGFHLFCYTNQPDISRGLVTAEMVYEQCDHINALCGIYETAICTHDDHHKCSCRKPKPGMLYALAFDHHIVMDKSWAIGDRDKDIQAARAAGIPWKQTIQIANSPAMIDRISTKFVYDLPEAAEYILNNQ